MLLMILKYMRVVGVVMNKLLLPELGEGIDKATVACWHVKIGDEIKEGSIIL